MQTGEFFTQRHHIHAFSSRVENFPPAVYMFVAGCVALEVVVGNAFGSLVDLKGLVSFHIFNFSFHFLAFV